MAASEADRPTEVERTDRSARAARPHDAGDAVARRLRAGRMMLAGHTPAEAAAAVGVARQTAYTWRRRLDAGGLDALRAMTPGRPSRLDARQLQALRAALHERASAHGFDSDDWTLPRARELIERRFGVRFSDVHVGRLMTSLAPASRRRASLTSSARAPASSRSGGSTGPRRRTPARRRA